MHALFRRLWALLPLLSGPTLSPTQDDPFEGNNTAIVRQHPNPSDLTDRAPRLAAEGRFADALDLYVEALQAHGDDVVPVARDRYVGVRRFVFEALSRWPAQGRQAYRDRFDPLLRDRFLEARAAGDAEALRTLVRDSPLSRTAAHAAMHLARLGLEAGRDEEALQALGGLLRAAPDALDAPMAATLADLFARRGDTARLEALARQAAQALPDARVVRGDREIPLQRHLAERIDESTKKFVKPPPARATVDASWPMAGGDATATRVSPTPFLPRAAAWTARLPEPRYGAPDANRFGWADDWGWRRTGAHPVFPAVEGGIVLLHNGVSARAHALFAPTAEPLWTHQPPLPERKPLMFEERLAHTSLLHEGSAYVTLVTHILEPERQLGYLQVKYPFPKRALFSFDALTGRLRWRIGGNPDGSAFEDQLSFTAAPTPFGGRLYVPAVLQRLSQDPYQRYVLCLDPESGRVLWKTYVLSGGTEINLFGNSIREAVASKLAVTADRIFDCTNLGAVAALDRETGALEWIARYRQLPVRPTRQFPPPRNGLTWRNNPVVATDEAVIATPVDSEDLVALDPANGRTLYRIEQPRHRVNAIYGVRGSTLVLGGDFVRLFDLATGRILTQIEPFNRARGAGTGTIAGSRVFHPTEAGLSILDLDLRRELHFTPWRHVQGANVAIGENALLVTSREDTLEVYPEPVTRDEIRARVAEAPDDAAVLYAAGQRMLQLALSAEACELLERAAAAAASRADPASRRLAASSRRLLSITLRRMAADKLQAGDLAAAETLLGRAAAHAASPLERVETTLELAEVLIQRNRHDRLVDEMQALIRESPEALVGGRAAFEVAREKIETALRLRGRGVYAAWDRAARERFEKGRAGGSIDDLTGVYRLYPNSEAAPLALHEASRLLYEAGRWAEMMRWARLLAREHPGHERAADAYALMALSLEKRGLLGGARRLLLKMKRDLEDRRVTVDGAPLAVPEFVERRLALPEYARAREAEAGRPLAPPLQRRPDAAEVGLVLDPPLVPETFPRGRASTFFAATSGRRILIFDAAEGRRVARFEAPGPAVAIAWAGEKLVVRGDRYLLAADAVSGEILWTQEPGEPFQAARMVDEYVVTARTLPGDPVSRVSAAAAGSGEVAWSVDLAGVCRGFYPIGDELLVLASSPERLYALETESGRVLGVKEFGDAEPRAVAWAAADLVVLKIQGDNGTGVEAYAPGRFERPLWRRMPRGERARVAADSQWTVLAHRDRIEWVNAANGKLTYRIPFDLRAPGPMALADETLYLVDGDTLRAFRRDEEASSAPLPAAGQRDRRLEAHGRHLALTEDVYDASVSRFSYSARIFDRSLRALQEIEGETRFELPPALAVWNGLLLVGAEGKLVIYR
jgi:outer membrane protein assembly factor BamB/tetratricopeptide (TPR) repeat protein